MIDADLYHLFDNYIKGVMAKRGVLTQYALLRELFEKTWCRETASPGCQAAWTPANPAWGQCAVTALAVQTLCGGALVRTVVGEFGSHYYNHLVNGEDIAVYDLTRNQFPYGTAIQPGSTIERDYVLDSPRAVEARTKERYELLRSRLVEVMRNA